MVSGTDLGLSAVLPIQWSQPPISVDSTVKICVEIHVNWRDGCQVGMRTILLLPFQVVKAAPTGCVQVRPP